MTNPNKKAVSIVDDFKNQYLSSTRIDNFDRTLWDCLEILSASVDVSGETAKVNFSITIPPTYANHKSTLHGGAIATLFDGLSSSTLALISKKGYWDGMEVSRSLEISEEFFRPAPLGELLNAECEILHVGRRLATIRGVITRASDGAMLCSCQHEKFNPIATKL